MLKLTQVRLPREEVDGTPCASEDAFLLVGNSMFLADCFYAGLNLSVFEHRKTWKQMVLDLVVLPHADVVGKFGAGLVVCGYYDLSDVKLFLVLVVEFEAIKIITAMVRENNKSAMHVRKEFRQDSIQEYKQHGVLPKWEKQ